jgi:hypothetical protein
VHRHGVGRDERIELREWIDDLPTVEGYVDDAFVLVDANDAAEVAVEDLAVVVVLGLHHLVAGRER